MESNGDKEMRDKLRGVELPFDPKAWEQMDAMLEKDRKPKIFFWWWTGGIAACLFMAAGIFGYYQFANHTAAGSNMATVTNKENTANPNSVSNSTTAASPKGFQAPVGLTKPAATGNKSTTNNTSANQTKASSVQPSSKTKSAYENTEHTVSTDREAKPQRHVVALSKSARSSANGIATLSTQNPSAEKPKSGKSAKHNKGSLHNNDNNLSQTNRPDILAGNTTKNSEPGGNKSEAPGNEAILATATQPATAADLMLAMKPDALTTGDELAENDMKKKDGDDVDLKKLKKKVTFTYSLGLATNITGSTLGNQGNANIFTKKPSYMVGLTQDFMLLKRIAITTGFMFSQTSYTVPDFNYTCSITELNIPMGIKAYLISKSKVRFYLDAGIINHIKLKETFTSLYSNASANLSPATGFSFGPVPNGTGIASIYTNSFSGNDKAETGNYSLNQGKRYYASFYTGAGAEFVVKSKLVFFAEPLFYISLEKVLAPERYKYDLGLSGGFRYQF